ncbi:dTDP-glucose 4,6-dehydratase [Gammaproteobacteria bacterium]|nr:dTDP-glucose 4,6-dehydratase [Gammaproteobacteria bacterium]
MNIIVTGGAGFIGSALIRYLINNTDHKILNIDKLTYAGNLNSLNTVKNNKNYLFKKEDITNKEKIYEIFEDFQPDLIFHLAAESHVDNSIETPLEFVNTNVYGTAVMLESAYNFWIKCDKSKKENFRFLHISTDEVYGSLQPNEFFYEDSSYDPSSPYSASKASSDHLVRAWIKTYGFPAIVTNCSNNYGPYQNYEKLIPRAIHNALKGKKIPIYGNGSQVRDWLFVDDHVHALYKVMKRGKLGETYNIGGNNQKTNLEVVNQICVLLDTKINILTHDLSSHKELIQFVNDRPGHDKRYAMNITKISNELDWLPKTNFNTGIDLTVSWYIDNYEH